MLRWSANHVQIAHPFRNRERKSKVGHGELPRIRHGGPEESQAILGQVEGGERAGLKSLAGVIGHFNTIRQHHVICGRLELFYLQVASAQ